MDKILHTPKTLPGVKRLDAQTRTITAPIEHPLTQCWVLANRGALACARFCPLKGESSGRGRGTPVQDFVHSIGDRSELCCSHQY